MINLKSFIKKNSGNFIFLLLIIICIIFLIYANTPFCKAVKAGGHSFFSIFQLGMSEITSVFSRSINSIGESKRLKEENKLLKEQLTDYLKVRNENIELKNDAKKLRVLLDLQKTIFLVYDEEVKQIPAEIIAREPGNFYAAFTVNRGKKDGIKEKMAVVALYENYMGLVGKVVTVGNATSIVMPIFNSGFFVSARFQNSYFEGLINGLGENSRDLIMRYVQKQAKSEIKFEDLVISSGIGNVFPKGIHIGKVKAIRSKTYETSIDVEIEPVIDFSRLEYVVILENREQDE